jgi:hypothetical protein
MNRLIRGVVFGTSIAAATGGMAWFLPEMRISAEETNAHVEACAKVLGPVAVQATELPPACKQSDVERDFDYTYTVSQGYDADNHSYFSSASPNVYELPSAADFRQENLIEIKK